MQLAVVIVLYITTSLDECQASSLNYFWGGPPALNLWPGLQRSKTWGDPCLRTWQAARAGRFGLVPESDAPGRGVRCRKGLQGLCERRDAALERRAYSARRWISTTAN